jgi:hypothetical protein
MKLHIHDKSVYGHFEELSTAFMRGIERNISSNSKYGEFRLKSVSF